jgi:hypothetical protein
MSLLDVTFENVQITPEGLLENQFKIMGGLSTMDGFEAHNFSKKIAYSNGRFHFDITFYIDLHPDGQWTIKMDVGNHQRMIETWYGQKWMPEGMMIIPMKPRPIYDMQELQMMLTKEWIKAWLTDLVTDGKLQFEYSEMFATYL